MLCNVSCVDYVSVDVGTNEYVEMCDTNTTNEFPLGVGELKCRGIIKFIHIIVCFQNNRILYDSFPYESKEYKCWIHDVCDLLQPQ